MAAMSATPIFRKAILGATHRPTVARLVRRYGMRLGASRFVAGETLDECVVALRTLNDQGLRANTTLLGEGVDDEATAAWVVDQYVDVLDRIAAERLTANVALKLTHLGLDLGEEVAYRNVTRLVAHAATRGNFIRIDMEESARVDATLRIYRRLREAGHDNVGTVLQSYLYRTPDDLAGLLPLRPNLRIVKGAYLEPPEIAYQKKADVDAKYIELAERMLLEGAFTAIATHDERIIQHMIGFTERHGIGQDRFEFQMLYGIRSQLQRDLVARGYRVLVATPYGPEWYFYLMRRLAERPANLWFFLSNLVRR
jgi:proline dehydrogenase